MAERYTSLTDLYPLDPDTMAKIKAGNAARLAGAAPEVITEETEDSKSYAVVQPSANETPKEEAIRLAEDVANRSRRGIVLPVDPLTRLVQHQQERYGNFEAHQH